MNEAAVGIVERFKILGMGVAWARRQDAGSVVHSITFLLASFLFRVLVAAWGHLLRPVAHYIGLR